MNTAVIGMGSNIDPEKNVKKAKEILAKELDIKAESKLTWSKPVGRPEQNNFLNGSILVSTEFNRDDLKNSLKKIEKMLKRVRSEDKYAPRTIDLDIVVWNGEIVDKDFYKRDFLQKSVLEVMPELWNRKPKVQ